VYSELVGAWVAGVNDTDQWLEVDMALPYKFTKVYIQGREDADEWVTSYKIQYWNIDIGMWQYYYDAMYNDVSSSTTMTPCTTT